MAWSDARLGAAAVVLLALASRAHAADGQACAPADLAPVNAWLAQHPFLAGTAGADGLVAAACRQAAGNAGTTIVAAAYRGARGDRKNLAVALVDTASHQVRGAYKGVVEENEHLYIGRDTLRVDPTSYPLAPGVRSFGVDLASATPPPPCAGGTWDWRRTLFVVDGAAIRPVLGVIALSSWQRRPDPERCGAQNADLQESTTRTTFAADAHASGGFADLVVTDTVRGTSRRPRLLRYMLQYDGTAYRGQGGSANAWPTIVPERPAPR